VLLVTPSQHRWIQVSSLEFGIQQSNQGTVERHVLRRAPRDTKLAQEGSKLAGPRAGLTHSLSGVWAVPARGPATESLSNPGHYHGGLAHTHSLALLNLFNRGRQPASWKWCPPHQAGLDLFAHLAYPVDFTYHSLPMIPFPQFNPIYTSLETLLLPPTGALPIQGCLANESET
jgi:hypothetical protein